MRNPGTPETLTSSGATKRPHTVSWKTNLEKQLGAGQAGRGKGSAGFSGMDGEQGRHVPAEGVEGEEEKRNTCEGATLPRSAGSVQASWAWGRGTWPQIQALPLTTM